MPSMRWPRRSSLASDGANLGWHLTESDGAAPCVRACVRGWMDGWMSQHQACSSKRRYHPAAAAPGTAAALREPHSVHSPRRQCRRSRPYWTRIEEKRLAVLHRRAGLRTAQQRQGIPYLQRRIARCQVCQQRHLRRTQPL